MAIGLISNRQCVFTVSQHIHHIHNGELLYQLIKFSIQLLVHTYKLGQYDLVGRENVFGGEGTYGIYYRGILVNVLFIVQQVRPRKTVLNDVVAPVLAIPFITSDADNLYFVFMLSIVGLQFGNLECTRARPCSSEVKNDLLVDRVFR